MNPFTAAVDTQQRSIEATAEYLEKVPKLAEQVERVADIEVGLTPNEVVYEENKLELLHYTPEMAGIEPETRQDVPILIVYALINKPYILDLQPDRSVIRRLLEGGFDVYLIDWGEPSRLDAHLTLEDYVRRYTDNCVDVVAERSGQESINLLGYCMGGTMGVMYAALFPEKVRNLGLMAAGLCFDGTGGVLELWGEAEYYDAEQVADALGNIPADFLDIGFALMDPVSNYVSKYLRLYENVEDDEFVENFARMERWLDEGIDVAGETYTEFIEDIYQDNKLARNEYYLGDTHVDLGEIGMPIVQVIGHYDHLIPPESSTGFNDLVPSDDVTTFEARSGHIGLSVSSKSHDELWPNVAAWFAERSQPEADAEGEHEAEDETEPAAEATEELSDTEESTEPTGGEVHETEHPEAEPEPEDAETEAVETEAAETEAVETEDAETEAAETGAAETEAVEPEPEEAESAEVETTEPEPDEHDTAEGADEAVDTEGAEAPAEMDAEELDEAVEETADTDQSTFESPNALESVYGIGPRYAEQLRDAGVESIEALAAADADELSDDLDVSTDRIQEWIESAADHDET